MRVLNILLGDLPDIRIDKISRMYIELGQKVDILCYRGKKNDEISSLFELRRKNRNLNRGLCFLSYFSKRFFYKLPLYTRFQIEAVIRKNKYDFIHWNDLYGALDIIKIAKKYNCKVILDFHENYPYNMWSTGRDIGKTNSFYSLDKWLNYEKKVVSESVAIIVTAPEMRQRLIGMHYADTKKIYVVQNTELFDIRINESINYDLSKFSEKWILLYVGSASLHRGLDLVIKAIPSIIKQIKNFHFVLVGEGDSISLCKKLTTELGIANYVSFEGKKDYSIAQQYYNIAQMGIIPHYKYGQTDNTIPHKLYQNMLHGVPTLVSSCHSLQNIIHETGAGLVFQSGDYCSLSEKVCEFYFSIDQKKYSKNGINSIKEGNYSWQESRSQLLSAISEQI